MFSYTINGEGFPIVFLHGYAETKSTWALLINELKQSYACYALDLPGHGNAPIIEEFSISSMAAYVADFIKKHVKQNVLLVGHSMGGYVALEVARSYPQLIAGLGLVNSHAAADNLETIENRKKTIQILQNDKLTFLSHFVESLFYAPKRTYFQSLIEKLKLEAQQTKVETLIGTQKAMMERRDQLDLLLHASFPILFVVGKKDERIDLNKILGQTILPKRSFVLFLEESGHMSHIEATKETAALIESVVRFIIKN